MSLGPPRIAAAALALFLVAGAGPALSDAPMGQREVEEGLTCQCGCGLTVATCNHLECSFAIPVRREIAESLARGETGQQILERFKVEYGEKVLSSPVPEGFNLLAWIGPYAAILAAGGLMFTFLRRRASAVLAEPESSAPSADPAGGGGDERLARLQREVEELER